MTNWDVYEITTQSTPIHGVKLRGRIRKFAISHGIDLLTENATDADNAVRFALHHGHDADQVAHYILSIIPDAKIDLVLQEVTNPVLSKLKVNITERYQ